MFIPQHLKFIIFHRSLSVITISNSNEGRKLRFLLRLPLSLHIILLLSPSIPVQIKEGGGRTSFHCHRISERLLHEASQ